MTLIKDGKQRILRNEIFMLFESFLKSDAIGYHVGEFIYHVTPEKNEQRIKKEGFKAQSGVSINGKKYENRVYFATSLISAYDISVNFGSYRDDGEYVIFKISSDCLKEGYEKDPLFVHGIYVDYNIDKKYIIDVIKASDLFNKFNDDDIENLY